MKDIKLPIPFLTLFLLTCSAFGQERTFDSYEAIVTQRLNVGLEYIMANPWPSPEENIDQADGMALLLLFKNENVAEANRLVLAYCGRDPLTVYAGKRVPKVRCEALYRIYLLERTRKLLSEEARNYRKSTARH